MPVAVARRLERLSDTERASVCEPGALTALVGDLCDQCARSRVEELVGRRDYSAHELGQRLRADGYPEDVVAERVRRARRTGVVDDARYAASFARSKARAGWGAARIARELELRGVGGEEVRSALAEADAAGGERERALEAASRRRLTGRNDVQRIARFLCGRGFSPGLAFEVAREVVGEGSRA